MAEQPGGPMGNDSRGVVVCGETLVDLVPDGAALTPLAGGGPFNTAIATAKLGAPTALLSYVSRDALGRRCAELLAEAGVDLRLLVETEAPTSLALPDIDDAGVATYRFYWAGTSNDQAPGPFPPAPADFVPAAVHVASLATVLWPARADVLTWIRTNYAGAPITFDVNARPALLGDPAEYLRRAEPWLTACELARASSEDIEFLYPGIDFDEVAAGWFERFPRIETVLVTRGADGSDAYRRGAEPVHVPAVETTLVDTVGAGDTFTGAFLDSHYRLRLPLADSMRRAAVAAAIACSRRGAVPPTAAEVDARGTLNR